VVGVFGFEGVPVKDERSVGAILADFEFWMLKLISLFERVVDIVFVLLGCCI
jgi:hypothetical protein